MIENIREILKLKYDDYYKFLVSLGLIIFLISAGLIYYLTLNKVLTKFISFWLTIFLVGSIISFVLGITGWRKRQSDLDKLLSLDVEKSKESLEIIRLQREKERIGLDLSKKRIASFSGKDISDWQEKKKNDK